MIPKLPLDIDFFKKDIIAKTIKANIALAELNGVSKKIPNRNILINSLSLQEAKDSSEIENIITTHDELYKAALDTNFASNEAKEVSNYKEALLYGYNSILKDKVFLNRDIIKIQEILEKNDAGFRTQSGTKLKNSQTDEIVYVPPQTIEEIKDLMANLEAYINSDDDVDKLIKMAIIHHQFESIHPFYDGNGRTGRIINILYLVLKGLLDMPILYLSRYIINNKSEYYRLLQEVRTSGNRDNYIMYMLDAIEKTAINTIEMVNAIWDSMGNTKRKMREELPKIYSKDLLEIIYSHPYTKIEFLVENMKISRQRASRYLNELVNKGYMKLVPIGKSKYFVNIELFALLKKGL